jgi:hypothetical protein
MRNNNERNHLIELYKTTLEELRHHDTINHQILAASGVVFSLFVAAIGFLFSRDFHLQYVCWVKIGILVVFLVVELFFGFAYWRRLKQLEACEKVRNNIEDKLKLEFVGSLIGSELRKLEEKWKCWEWYRNWRRTIYLVVAILAFIALGVLLFVFM